ncbi:UDP-glucose 4-epimerase GalE [Candidatus Collierbacteria bacterium RIFOXYB1_FULL_49_13]|uniref:UDP-glucose 4-epimerase n=1 Tax=Candidatus Collierbacteria bacterium RIFOXYB1_FULL_49_13 TaxID=1817728 RepID=A0A1F5FHK4_9BACT|nr:MAG: UDP-glucose 4-epimerase GalE [Candidatus Collierbacteria bacterium RIFOXYB1_FULL_49_13]
MSKKVFITGGAGYIGSVTNRFLKDQGYDTVIFDSMELGHDWACLPAGKAISGTKLIQGNLTDKAAIKSALEAEHPDAVIHFGSYIQMGESYQNPGKYYRNNILGALNLLESMVELKLNHLVFSSSAGVYGSPDTVPIPETAPKLPENPYGQNKLDIENMLHWFDLAHGLTHIALRYFNACGAAPDWSLGEAHEPESHIIPIFINRALGGESLTINGQDYHTPDHTCVRDYVHVLDLASAHKLALEALLTGADSNVYNIGTGRGFSNLEIAREILQATGSSLPINYGPRRPGDADSLVADSSKIQAELGWKPVHSSLENIISTALAWHKSRLNPLTKPRL